MKWEGSKGFAEFSANHFIKTIPFWPSLGANTTTNRKQKQLLGVELVTL